MESFTSGVNLGGWLSQYAAYNHDHFRTFITKSDIERIANWGMDHVRLPIDFPVIENPDVPGEVRETGYEYIDQLLGWCQANGLGVILDIHEAPGFTFRNDLESNTSHRNMLFDDLAVQDRFVALWQEIARRYADAPVPVIFELLNEVTTPTNEKWNLLAARTVSAIREITADVPIMIGGNVNNGIPGLKGLVEFPDDPNIIYTVHTYEPLFFTHQSAPWDQRTRTWGQRASYPGALPALAEFIEEHPEWSGDLTDLVGRTLDREYMEEVFAPAIEFANRTGGFVYCGEFGVADWVDSASRVAWLRDVLGIMRRHGMGFGLWTYKQMDFGLVNADGEVVDQDYLEVLIEAAQ
jgi:hypothetical protein